MLEPLEAVIRVVRPEEKYAVAYITDQGEKHRLIGIPITFSFQVWKSRNTPMKGQCVTLHDVSKFERGWRALEARPITPKERN